MQLATVEGEVLPRDGVGYERADPLARRHRTAVSVGDLGQGVRRPGAAQVVVCASGALHTRRRARGVAHADESRALNARVSREAALERRSEPSISLAFLRLDRFEMKIL